MSGSRVSPVTIIGVGNEYRRDDGAGIVVARELRARTESATAASIHEASGEGTALMDLWQESAQVFLIDAVASGARHGSVYRFDPAVRMIPAGFFHYSTHAFSVAEAIELARSLGILPPHLIVYGIEGADFGAGPGLSQPVAAVVPDVVTRIESELRTSGSA